MDVTIMNPGVIAPSQMPRNARHAKNAPKFFAAAWHSSAIDHTRMLKLQRRGREGEGEEGGVSVPCPLGGGAGSGECFACAAARARERGRGGWGGGVRASD